MKKITIIMSFLIFMAFITNAQIPNNGFENWVTIGSYENPVGWATMNYLCAGPFYSVTKSTDHYPASVGSYSVRVENNTSLTQQTGGWGMVITDTMAYPFEAAFPIIGNPASLCGYYKFNSMNEDSMFIRIVFFAGGAMLGYNTFVNGITASSWTPFTLPITYTSADSATLYLSAFWPTSQISGPKGNSVLYIDNLSFDNLISVSEQNNETKKMNLFPNPASEIITLDIDKNDNNCLLNIYNAMGALVRTEILKQNQQQINIGDLNYGIYFVEIKSDNYTERQKLIIQR